MWPLKRKLHDPAPSRWAYRLQRLWLTPFYRRAILTGLPLCFFAGAGVMAVSDALFASRIGQAVAEVRGKVEDRPEFLIQHIQLLGAEGDDARLIRQSLNVELPISSFKLDLGQLRKQVEQLDSVRTANLYLRSGGLLEMQIERRIPVALIRSEDQLELVDLDGVRAAVAVHRSDHGELPLLVGVGAKNEVAEALSLFATAAPYHQRILGLQRVGERRWNLILDRNQVIKLPEDKPVLALKRLIALDKARDLLNRDIESVDLRLSKRPFLRLTPHATEELKILRAIEKEGDA